LNVFDAEVDGKPGVAILLSYGPDRDWLKNLNAAGGGRMRRHAKTFRVINPQTMTKEEAAPHVIGAGRRVFPRIPFEQAVLLTKAD
jgi:deazaflavin-dependent oxidoreductase (nitroreductase family)